MALWGIMKEIRFWVKGTSKIKQNHDTESAIILLKIEEMQKDVNSLDNDIQKIFQITTIQGNNIERILGLMGQRNT